MSRPLTPKVVAYAAYLEPNRLNTGVMTKEVAQYLEQLGYAAKSENPRLVYRKLALSLPKGMYISNHWGNEVTVYMYTQLPFERRYAQTLGTYKIVLCLENA